MDRQIFNMGLTVEATSAYIVITSLLGDNQRPSLDMIKNRWTLSDETLDRALAELTDRNVLQSRSGPDGMDLYYPTPASLWR
jgi:DNA-binding IscR family transcriptional regulator